jgi:hypothetical protein
MRFVLPDFCGYCGVDIHWTPIIDNRLRFEGATQIMDTVIFLGILLVGSSLVIRGKWRKDVFLLGITLIVLYFGEVALHPAIFSPEYAVPIYSIWKPLLILFPVALAVIYLHFVLWNHGILQRIPKKIKKIKIW